MYINIVDLQYFTPNTLMDMVIFNSDNTTNHSKAAHIQLPFQMLEDLPCIGLRSVKGWVDNKYIRGEANQNFTLIKNLIGKDIYNREREQAASIMANVLHSTVVWTEHTFHPHPHHHHLHLHPPSY